MRDRALEILGNPEVEIVLWCDRPQALLAARLCDVWPDGASTLITRGLLNLSQRNSKGRPEPRDPSGPVLHADSVQTMTLQVVLPPAPDGGAQ